MNETTDRPKMGQSGPYECLAEAMLKIAARYTRHVGTMPSRLLVHSESLKRHIDEANGGAYAQLFKLVDGAITLNGKQIQVITDDGVAPGIAVPLP